MEDLEQMTQVLEQEAKEEAELLQAAAEQGRHDGDGPEDVAEVDQNG